MKKFLLKLWKAVNSPLFDFFGGLCISIGSILYFIGYREIVVDVPTAIFTALLVIGMDCLGSGGGRLICPEKNGSMSLTSPPMIAGSTPAPDTKAVECT